MKLNPRTGVIELGRSARKPRVADTPPRKKAKSVQPDPDILAMVERIGRSIGRSIVEAIQKMPSPEVVHVPSAWIPEDMKDQPETTLTVSPVPPGMIYMDETIIDVGLGNTEDLKTGDGSASLAKEEEQEDCRLSNSKQKLQKLKRKA